MAKIGEIMRVLRIKRGISQAELAGELGLKRSAIGNYELGLREPDLDTIEAIADFFDVSIADLMGREESQPSNALPPGVVPMNKLHVQKVPMIGEVAAGEPIYAPEDVDVYVDAPVKCDAAITIRGDSMSPNYLPGDVVYIKCTPDVPEGTVAVVFLDDEATLKHVYKRKTGLTLWSDNPEYMPMQIEFEDYNRVRIFGVPVGFTRIFKPDNTSRIRKGFH